MSGPPDAAAVAAAALTSSRGGVASTAFRVSASTAAYHPSDAEPTAQPFVHPSLELTMGHQAGRAITTTVDTPPTIASSDTAANAGDALAGGAPVSSDARYQEDCLEILKRVFTNIEADSIKSVLAACNNDANHAFTVLLRSMLPYLAKEALGFIWLKKRQRTYKRKFELDSDEIVAFVGTIRDEAKAVAFSLAIEAQHQLITDAGIPFNDDFVALFLNDLDNMIDNWFSINVNCPPSSRHLSVPLFKSVVEQLQNDWDQPPEDIKVTSKMVYPAFALLDMAYSLSADRGESLPQKTTTPYAKQLFGKVKFHTKKGIEVKNCTFGEKWWKAYRTWLKNSLQSLALAVERLECFKAYESGPFSVGKLLVTLLDGSMDLDVEGKLSQLILDRDSDILVQNMFLGRSGDTSAPLDDSVSFDDLAPVDETPGLASDAHENALTHPALDYPAFNDELAVDGELPDAVGDQYQAVAPARFPSPPSTDKTAADHAINLLVDAALVSPCRSGSSGPAASSSSRSPSAGVGATAESRNKSYSPRSSSAGLAKPALTLDNGVGTTKASRNKSSTSSSSSAGSTKPTQPAWTLDNDVGVAAGPRNKSCLSWSSSVDSTKPSKPVLARDNDVGVAAEPRNNSSLSWSLSAGSTKQTKPALARDSDESVSPPATSEDWPWDEYHWDYSYSVTGDAQASVGANTAAVQVAPSRTGDDRSLDSVRIDGLDATAESAHRGKKDAKNTSVPQYKASTLPTGDSDGTKENVAPSREPDWVTAGESTSASSAAEQDNLENTEVDPLGLGRYYSEGRWMFDASLAKYLKDS